jgi:hypothetical protein
VPVVSSILVAVIFFGLSAFAARVEAQQPAGASQSRPINAPAGAERAKSSKTELANRFREINDRYASIRTAVEKFAPLKPDAALDLKVARLKLVAAMRSYEYYLAKTQKQRDQLNLLTDFSEFESLRLQVSMDRLSKMQALISNLMTKMNDTGDALAQNTR